MRGHRDDRCMAVLDFLERANFPARLKAVHFRHLHVHQHHVIRNQLVSLDRLVPIGHHVGPMAEILEQTHRHLLIDVIIVGDENAQRLPRRKCRSAVSRS